MSRVSTNMYSPTLYANVGLLNPLLRLEEREALAEARAERCELNGDWQGVEREQRVMDDLAEERATLYEEALRRAERQASV